MKFADLGAFVLGGVVVLIGGAYMFFGDDARIGRDIVIIGMCLTFVRISLE